MAASLFSRLEQSRTEGTLQQGMSTTVVRPPDAAAADPVSKVSLWVNPGSILLSHEIAHVALRHGLSSIQGSRLAQIAAEYALNASLASGGEAASFTEAFGEAISELATVLLISGYSQGFELQADSEAKRILLQAAYDPGALDRLIAKLPSQDQSAAGFAQTHPKPSFRIEALRDDLIAPAGVPNLSANPFGHKPAKRYWPNPRPEDEGLAVSPIERSYARVERFNAIRELF